MEEDNPYNSETSGLIYEPSGEKPSVFDLADIRKMLELTDEIDQSSLPPEEKEFLRIAAMRHVVFDYGKIADYFANSDKEMRSLMERSVLVIVDYDKAVEEGYVKLRNAFDDLLEMS